MLIIKEIDIIIDNHLKKEYGDKFTRKYFNHFREFLSNYLLKLSYDNLTRNNYNNYLKGLKYNYILMKEYEFLIPYKKTRVKYPVIRGNTIGRSGRVRLLDIMIKTFIDLKILKLMREKQLPITDNTTKVRFSTKRYWKIKLPKVCTFEYTKPVEFNDNIYNINHNEIMDLQYNNDYKDFIKYFFQYLYAAKNGYKMINDEVGENRGPRQYHTFTNLSKVVRELITINGKKTETIDIRSSHPFWLSVITGSEKLYQDILNKEIKKKFKKIQLLTWFNNENYDAYYYKYFNDTFLNEYCIDTFKFRTGKTASLFEPLAKMESDYLIKGISNKLDVSHFTIHDQIYYLPEDREKIDILIKELSNKYEFEPIWD